jgi:hypothetical protein
MARRQGRCNAYVDHGHEYNVEFDREWQPLVIAIDAGIPASGHVLRMARRVLVSEGR